MFCYWQKKGINSSYKCDPEDEDEDEEIFISYHKNSEIRRMVTLANRLSFLKAHEYTSLRWPFSNTEVPEHTRRSQDFLSSQVFLETKYREKEM